MSRLTRDGTAEPVSRDQILRHSRGQENIHFPCSADHEQDWQPYPVDPYSAICDDHTYIHTYIYTLTKFRVSRLASLLGAGADAGARALLSVSSTGGNSGTSAPPPGALSTGPVISLLSGR